MAKARGKSDTSDLRQQKMAELYAAMDKAVGPGAGLPYGEQPIEAIPRIPTGFVGLDWATCGGIPRGRIVELFGTESGGKTTLALYIAAQVQRMGGHAAFIDAEYALDTAWATQAGVDVKALHILQPETGEEALTAADLMAASGVIDVVIVDSVSALVPKAELEGKMGEAFVGLQARMMSQALRKMTGHASRGNTTVIFINQLREKIGQQFGSPETTSGGRALKFYASMRLDVRRIGEQMKQGEDRVGDMVRIRVVKNKSGRPFRSCEIPMVYDVGFDPAYEAFELGLSLKVVSQNGASYAYGEHKLGVGKRKAVETLRAEYLPTIQADLAVRLQTGELG